MARGFRNFVRIQDDALLAPVSGGGLNLNTDTTQDLKGCWHPDAILPDYEEISRGL